MATPVQIANGPLPVAANTTLTSSIPASGAASPTVASAAFLPAVGPFQVIVDTERIEVDSISGTTLTILAGGRAQEGTSAAAHSSGAAVWHVLSAATLARHIDDRAAKGWVDKAVNTADVTLSTAAGTYSDVVVGNAFTPAANRRYKLTYWAAGGDLLVSGTGLATTDTWSMKFQVSVGGGAYVDVPPFGWLVVRPQVAQAMRYPVPTQHADYVAASAATLQFKAVAAKTAGAATVTSTLSTDNHLLVEDTGPT